MAYGRNDVDGRWYEYDDRRVTVKTPAEVERVEAYLLFYRRKSPARATERKRAETLVHPIAPAADAASTDAVLISRAWYIRWLTCVDPGPVTNADLLCPHGGTCRAGLEHPDGAGKTAVDPWLTLFPSLSAGGSVFILPYQALSRRVSTKNVNVSELVYEVPRSLYLEWCKRFGSDGLPATTALPACKACADYEEALAQRRVEENDQIAALDSVTIADGHVWYIIASAWLRQWTDFKRGGPLPGPVDNKVLVDARGNARPGLQKGEGLVIEGWQGESVGLLGRAAGASPWSSWNGGGASACLVAVLDSNLSRPVGRLFVQWPTTVVSTKRSGTTLSRPTAAGRRCRAPSWTFTPRPWSRRPHHRPRRQPPTRQPRTPP